MHPKGGTTAGIALDNITSVNVLVVVVTPIQHREVSIWGMASRDHDPGTISMSRWSQVPEV